MRRNHPDVASSHIRMYDWIEAHATLRAAFSPGRHRKGDAVLVYVSPRVPTASGHSP